jgi:hypothetical protein
MARDTYGIALQSVDPDLQTEGSDLIDGGATDLMDFAASVGQWGQDSTEALAGGGGTQDYVAPGPTGTRCRPEPVFHASTRITTPFTVAAVVLVVILVIVLIPSGGN